MIRFFENYSLKRLNTFGISATARYFFEFTEPADLQEFMRSNLFKTNDIRFVMGGGSNLLFLNDFDGLIIFPNIPGISIEREERNHIWVRAGAGVVWDDFVSYVVREDWGGVENLSLIPGRVGAAAVQNIGAYGQEIAVVIESVAGIDLLTGEGWSIESDQCGFGYRNSIFKSELKNTFIITSVLFRLDKFPELLTGYRGVAEAIQHIQKPGISDVRNAVVSIRRSKLPDPEIIGNAGSFFKNPVVSAVQAETFQKEYPNIPIYPGSEGSQVKLSAGWLIDYCGWKGQRRAGAGVHEQHALVLVNHGNASGREIFDLSEAIRQSVFDRFGVELEREVEVIGL
jgi:UDP-N-acetylmuramate dehydrogenase